MWSAIRTNALSLTWRIQAESVIELFRSIYVFGKLTYNG